MEVERNVNPIPRDGNISQRLSDLDLQVDQTYNICVTAKNFIGHSAPGCHGSYIHMETEGMYVFMYLPKMQLMLPIFITETSSSDPLLVYAGTGGGAVVFILIVLCVATGMYMVLNAYLYAYKMYVCSVVQ